MGMCWWLTGGSWGAKPRQCCSRLMSQKPQLLHIHLSRRLLREELWPQGIWVRPGSGRPCSCPVRGHSSNPLRLCWDPATRKKRVSSMFLVTNYCETDTSYCSAWAYLQQLIFFFFFFKQHCFFPCFVYHTVNTFNTENQFNKALLVDIS